MNKYQEALEGIVDLATAYDFEATPGSNYPRYYRNEDLFATEEARDEDIKLLQQAVNKAQKYDQLTNQLGCPIEILMKVLENGIYYKGKFYKNACLQFQESVWHFWVSDKYGDEFLVYLKDYKKTWWTKEDMSE